MDFFLIINILGVVAFSISGVLSSMKKKMDPLGILIIAFVASVGGGTLRDLLIDAPVEWMRDLIYVHVVIVTTIFAIIFRKKLVHLRKSIFLFDTIGIGLYTVIGVEKGLSAEFSPIICIAIGTITACFGGVLRDILCNEIPLLFKTKEIYAIACILGGGTYFLLQYFQLSQELIFIVSGSVVIITRSLAVYFDIRLPSVYINSDE
ncbi:Uncharacterized membrane protein YeiH [Mesonia phycicola]|uniref:Uncharacterized membrane protein YeiH n=1 Tax=Mesonia phycicola TaxID=579105 RepID=A0A1M6C518_9FLAO|nr:trimeric intracellular cation channel family protein [Mesonia phycicola]SHI56116.1 Uncharacterized membrane protein YeiH [Mesonia phycicola]